MSLNEPPDVDLSAVTHNSVRWVAAFVESVLAQTYPTDRLSLIIRDHESTDGTLDLCRELREIHRAHFARFEVMSGPNHGFGFGHNRNRELGRAPYFLVTNVDLRLEPDAIARVVAAAEGDSPQVAAWELRQKPFEHPKWYDPCSLDTTWASSACVLLRRTALDDVGGYDERIFLYGEDVDLSFRLRDRGFSIRYAPKAVCWHYSYEDPHTVKPAQFFGDTLSNIYLRLRFGTLLDVLSGLARQLSLWIWHPSVPRVWAGLAQNTLSALRNAPYFLRTRKRSRIRFHFHGWGYAVHREGAFVPARPVTPDPPLVSVIVRTDRGRLAWLEQAIASVVNQTYPQLELIVVEDGAEEARALLARLVASGCLASVVYLPIAKAGRCVAGNAGLAAARGEIIGFLDDDGLYFADHVETLVAELLAQPSLGAIYGLAFQVQTRVLSSAPLQYEETSCEVIHRQGFSRALLWRNNYIPIQTILFRRILYDQYGGLDESLDNLEDWNLWTRYSLQRDFDLVPKVTSLYRVPADRDLFVERQKAADPYYAAAVEKQRELRMTLSPADFTEMSRELSRTVDPIRDPFLTVTHVPITSRCRDLLYYAATCLANKLRRSISTGQLRGPRLAARRSDRRTPPRSNDPAPPSTDRKDQLSDRPGGKLRR